MSDKDNFSQINSIKENAQSDINVSNLQHDTKSSFLNTEQGKLTVPGQEIQNNDVDDERSYSIKKRQEEFLDDINSSEKSYKWSEKGDILVQYEFPELDEWRIIKKENSESHFNTIHKTRILVFNTYYSYFIMVTIMITLFGSNLKFLLFDKRADTIYDIITLVVMIIFLFDFIANLMIKIDYFISFYFWMDLTSFFLLFFDYSQLREYVFEQDTTVNKIKAYNWFLIYEVLRILRIMQLSKNFFRKRFKNKMEYYEDKLLMSKNMIDFILKEDDENREKTQSETSGRITKISFNNQKYSYKSSEQRVTQLTKTVQSAQIVQKGEKVQESKISRRMIYLTNKRLMMVMLFMLVLIPMFSTYFWQDITHSYETDLKFLTIYYLEDKGIADEYLKQQLVPTYEDYLLQILYINLPTIVDQQLNPDENIRKEEIRFFKGVVDYQEVNYSMVGEIRVSFRKLVQYQALLSIIRIIIIIIFFIIGVYFFEKDAREKILGPLERMLAKVKSMSENPSKALALSKKETVKYNSDIAVIDETIQKIAYLLVLGFGEAGNSLLSKILYTKEFQIDFLSEPSLVYAVYGFCDIRNFTDATEILKEDVLLFVNEIAEVVHEEVHKSEGGANKNIGDAFLVVWKLHDNKNSNIEQYLDPISKKEHKEFMNMNNSKLIDQQTNQKVINDKHNSYVAEFSLVSFLKIISRITTDEEITKYNSDKRLIRQLPGFYVNLGFGLHIGWSIEGAIGSKFKIDMSYLSPNVNWSSRLEGLTKLYKKEILFTDTLYYLFSSKKLKELCRKVDRVHVRGATHPTDIFTIDIHVEELREWYKQQKIILQQQQQQIQIKKSEVPNNVTRLKVPEEKSKRELQSYKQIRLDNYPQNLIKKELQNQGIDISHITVDQDSENYQYFPEIETMYENITLDPKLMILLELNKSEDFKKFPSYYKTEFEDFVNLYQNKRWDEAKEKVKDLKDMIKEQSDKYKDKNLPEFVDPCIDVLIDEMKNHNWKAPINWLGREVGQFILIIYSTTWIKSPEIIHLFITIQIC